MSQCVECKVIGNEEYISYFTLSSGKLRIIRNLNFKNLIILDRKPWIPSNCLVLYYVRYFFNSLLFTILIYKLDTSFNQTATFVYNFRAVRTTYFINLRFVSFTQK